MVINISKLSCLKPALGGVSSIVRFDFDLASKTELFAAILLAKL